MSRTELFTSPLCSLGIDVDIYQMSDVSPDKMRHVVMHLGEY